MTVNHCNFHEPQLQKSFPTNPAVDSNNGRINNSTPMDRATETEAYPELVFIVYQP